MKRVVLLLFCVTCSVLLFSQPAVKIDDCGLLNLYKVDEGVYRSEQPDRKQFEALEKDGIKEILNLRYWHSDKKHAKKTNLRLHRIKMNAHDANDFDVVSALRIIKNRQGAILIHCHHGSDRTGLIVAMYRIVFQNISKEKAITEMITGGFGFHEIYDNIPRYINNVNIDNIRKQLNIK
ncbi:MAG: dual specificity protein phosphatase family protein [Prevotellaceae bacterium]|jgi:protein tyrosine/serine phosphatase|nr:dual specificity protein phosphatase family protein [Prevotellaceae bacterium]